MSPIDASRLVNVLKNIKDHLEESCTQYDLFGASWIEYVIEVVRIQPVIAPPPNPPLTLEELRGMDGEPVWLERVGDNYHIYSAWALVNREHCLCRTADGSPAFFELFGTAWRAYRRKPEEGTI